MACGPGKTDDNGKVIPMGVKVGERILFGKYSGQEFKLEGQAIERHPEWKMSHRRLLHHMDLKAGTIEIDGKIHPLLDKHFLRKHGHGAYYGQDKKGGA